MRCEVAGKRLGGSGTMAEGEEAAEVSRSSVISLFSSTSNLKCLNEPTRFAVFFFFCDAGTRWGKKKMTSVSQLKGHG